MPIFLNGLALRNYRGIGDDEQTMAPFKSFNIFIGANNSGKSGPLNFISKYLNIIGTKQSPSALEPLELHAGAGAVSVSIGISRENFLQSIRRGDADPSQIMLRLIETLSSSGLVWLSTELPSGKEWSLKDWGTPRVSSALAQGEWQLIWRELTSQGGGSLALWMQQVRERLAAAQKPIFAQTRLIPAIREISSEKERELDYSGNGLIARLAELQNPNYNHLGDRILFKKINRFLQQVTGNSTANIQIPNAKEHILVEMDTKTLPLSSLGTGIHEVVLMAALCTLSQNEVICMEEPELHLHPLLQKKLVRYLIDETNNQYFIATHSPSFIDTAGAAIFHVRNENEKTKIRETVLRESLYDLCDDLGHRASELVQANAVIWVEGPSDRIYLKHWLLACDARLIEGIHYSIIFYGGRLLSHLTVEQDELQEFIDLRTLNRNVAILIDSDRDGDGDGVNATKDRVKKEFEAGKSVAWITAGREIENYIEPVALERALKAVYPALFGTILSKGRYSHSLHFSPSVEAAKTRKDGNLPVTNVDKVAVAKEITKEAANLNVLDLQERLTELVMMIRKANGF